MEYLSREEIIDRMKIDPSQFKSFRRLGLIDGYAKKISVVKKDEKKTKARGKDHYTPAGFSYLYPKTVLKQIKWILEKREQGFNLMEIQSEYIRKKITEEENFKADARGYERVITVSGSSHGSNNYRRKQIRQAIQQMTQQILDENPHRDIKTLVFSTEPYSKEDIHGDFVASLKIRLDVECSQI